MTGTYDLNPMPHKVDINCPSCGEHAVFEFAEVVQIKLKKDVLFFEQSDLFEYSLFRDSCGHNWHGAIYFANLHGGSTKAIRELPEGYQPDNWAHSRFFTRSHGIDIGAYCCTHCFSRKCMY